MRVSTGGRRMMCVLQAAGHCSSRAVLLAPKPATTPLAVPSRSYGSSYAPWGTHLLACSRVGSCFLLAFGSTLASWNRSYSAVSNAIQGGSGQVPRSTSTQVSTYCARIAPMSVLGILGPPLVKVKSPRGIDMLRPRARAA